ncbi:MAG: hypothetical protein QOK48_144 [Blastocatellia bacterium]|nr:hypothetical protein [Blastocatellia bacterium]
MDCADPAASKTSRASTLPTRLVLLGLTALWLILGAPNSLAQSFVTDEGDYVEASLKLDKDVIMLGEATYMTFRVKVLSSRTLCIGVGGDYRNNLGRPESYKVTVRREDGKLVPQPDAGITMGGFVDCNSISADKAYTARLFLPQWATFEETGTYEIALKRDLNIRTEQSKPVATLAADLKVKIKVVAKDDEQVGSLIKSLGSLMLDSNNEDASEAANLLGYFRDQRSLEFFVTALRKYATSWQLEDNAILTKAMWAFSQFNDDRAIAALEWAIDNASEVSRIELATALWLSKHPRAPEILLRLQNNSDSWVRRWVAQGLERLQTEESRAVLRKMLKDADEDVRKAALNSLNALAEKAGRSQ